jgi:ABC transporter, ATP-binding protein
VSVLELFGLAVGYRARRRQKVVLEGLEASLEEGHLVGLVGPNGAGKSTLLRTVSGLQPPLAGSVRLLGRDLERIRRDDMARQVAVVLTDRVDPGRLTVADVIALGRHPHTGWSGRLGASDREAVAVALEAVGAEELAERMLWELSDGQRQRVMIARAIAQAPRLLLLDEPTAFLDPPGRIRVFELLQDLAYDRGIAVVVCTHDVEVAARHADRLWVVGPDDGMRTGVPHELAHDGTLEAAFGGDVGFDPDSYTFVSNRSQPDRGGRQGKT